MKTTDLARRHEDGDDGAPRGFQITKRIDAGHIMQAGVHLIVGIAFLVAVYIFLLTRQNDLESKLQLANRDIQANKEYITRVDAEQRQLSTEIRAKLDELIKMVGYLQGRQGPTIDAPHR